MKTLKSLAVSAHVSMLMLSKVNISRSSGHAMAGNIGHWGKGLLSAMNDPNVTLHSDDQVVIIRDKYPKAKYHFLVLPRRQIQSLKHVTRNDLDLMRHMQKQGEIIAERANMELQFRLGYHVVPSMSHLHMHVISQDFNSSFLKTKKHWNSFTTPYFVDSDAVIKEIEGTGHFLANVEEMSKQLKLNLRCHVCRKVFETIPSLKAHIVLHDVTKDAHSL